MLRQLRMRHAGQGLVEYALVIVLVVIVVIIVLYLVGEKMPANSGFVLPYALRMPA